MGGRDGCLYCLSSLSAGTCDWWLDNIGNDFHHWFSFVTSPCPRPSCCPLLCWLGCRRHWHCPLELRIRLPFVGKICICRKFSASAGHQFYPAGHHVLYIATFLRFRIAGVRVLQCTLTPCSGKFGQAFKSFK